MFQLCLVYAAFTFLSLFCMLNFYTLPHFPIIIINQIVLCSALYRRKGPSPFFVYNLRWQLCVIPCGERDKRLG